MSVYTGGQLRLRFVALAIGLLGGMTELVWVHTINLNCDFGVGGGITIVSNCPGWMDIFLRYTQERVSLISGVVFIGGFATLAAGTLALWSPVIAATIFFVVAVINLAAVLVGWTSEQPSPALISSIFLVAVPLAMGAVLAKWGR